MQEVEGTTNNKALDPCLWKWSNNMPTTSRFMISNKLAYELILGSSTEWIRLNERWNMDDIEDRWKEHWKKLWGSDLTWRENVFLWEVIMNGMYTTERANKMGHGDGLCSLYPGSTKIVDHLLYQCLKAQRRWVGNAIYFKANPNQSFLVHTLHH